jgi:hypothetical protein
MNFLIKNCLFSSVWCNKRYFMIENGVGAKRNSTSAWYVAQPNQKMDEEKWKHGILAQQNGFGAASFETMLKDSTA